MTGFSNQVLEQTPHLISDSMETRMQSREAFQQLQATLNAIQQLQAVAWSGRCADDPQTAKNPKGLDSAHRVWFAGSYRHQACSVVAAR